MKPEDNISNMHNDNKGTTGINEQRQKMLDNRNRQLQETRARKGGK